MSERISLQTPEQARSQENTTLDTSKYTPEQLKVYEQIQQLKKTLETMQAQEMFSKRGAQILQTKLSADPTIKDDPDAKPTIELYQKYLQRFQEAVAKGGDIKTQLIALESEVVSLTDRVEYLSGINEKGEDLSLDDEKLKNISSKKFLALPHEERLQYVTKNNIDSSSISGGSIKEITFSFDQDSDKKLNQELYMLTTAGQVLPKEVREVTKDGQKYTRIGVSGEFYDGEKRLTIHDNTTVNIDTLANQEQMNALTEQNFKAYNEFITQNPSLSGEKYKQAISEAIEKGIEPKMFLKVLSRRIEEFEQQNPLSPVEIEFIATEVTKVPGYDKSGIESAANVLRYLTPTTWRESLKELGFDDGSIQSYYTTHKDDAKFDMSRLENFTPAEYSYPAERSKSGTTLCSMTARFNLSRLGIENPSTGGSARAAWEHLGSPKNPFPPQGQTDAKVADLYLDARSEKNQQYGHRVAAFKAEDGQWFVLDPYYSMFGNTRKPIPAEHYVQTVSDKQKIWGAKFY